MSKAKFMTLRHIETVRNYLDTVIVDLMSRGQRHDQTKLQSPEVEVFEQHTHKLKYIAYGSEQYKDCMKEMKPAIDHHNKHNRHHPEFHVDGWKDMNLMDLIEMLVDWKASTMRTKSGDIYNSIMINQERFGYSDDIKHLLINTMGYIERYYVTKHHANES